MIFLYSFEHDGRGFNFNMNDGLAKDMYPDIHERLMPLIHEMSDALLPYVRFSSNDTILTGKLLDTDEFEVMLCKGLGDFIDQHTKHERIFKKAKLIADLLFEVMRRRFDNL